MNRTRAAMTACMLALAGALALAQPSLAVRIIMQTELGVIELDIDTVNAPVSAGNFLKYVDAGLYDGGQFRRTVRPDNQAGNPVPIAVIQGTASPERRASYFPAIPLERTSVTGIAHKDGTISLARAAPDTATNEFFICIGDQPQLDFGGKRNPDGQGFAAFGRVVRGMDVVKKIQMAPADGETLSPMIKIIRVRRVSM